MSSSNGELILPSSSSRNPVRTFLASRFVYSWSQGRPLIFQRYQKMGMAVWQADPPESITVKCLAVVGADASFLAIIPAQPFPSHCCQAPRTGGSWGPLALQWKKATQSSPVTIHTKHPASFSCAKSDCCSKPPSVY